METLAFVGGHIGGAQREPAAIGHGVARIDREIHDHLLELRDVDLDRPEIAPVHHLERDLLADQPAQQHVEIAEDLADVEHLRAQSLLAREGKELAHQARRPVGVLLDLDDVLERRVGRLVGVEQKIARHHDGGEHIVEVMRDAAGELADELHLLLLGDLGLQLALRGGLERIDDGGFLVALGLFDRGDVEARETLVAGLAGERRIDRRDVALAERRLRDRGIERRPVARGGDRADRAIALPAQHGMEQPREQRIGAHDAAVAIDGRDRHRRVVEEPHEADLGGALRIGAVVAGAIEHQRARGAGPAVGAEREPVEQANRQRAAVAGLQIEVEHLGPDLAGCGAQRGQQRRAVAGDEVGQFEAAGADLGEVLVEPVGERGVEVDDVAFAIDGKEPGRRVIEIVDRVLQFLKDILLPLALAGDVGQRPDREAALAPALGERPHPQPQPARRPAMHPGDAHLLLQALAFTRRLEEPVDRFGRVGVADEHALDRAHVPRIRGADQIEIGGIGVDDAAAAIGDGNAVERIVDQRLDQRAAGVRRRQPQDAAGEREQREYADRRQHREEDEDVRLGAATAEHHDRGRGGDQHGGDDEHQDDAAAAAAGAAVDRLACRRRAGGTLGHALRGHPLPRRLFPPPLRGVDGPSCLLRAP